MRRIFNQIKSKHIVCYSILLASIGVAVFDLLLLTVWRSANWNYQYPEWALIYDPIALLIFLFIATMMIVRIKYLLSISERKFILIVLVSGILISTITYFITPVSSLRITLSPLGGPENYEYYPATVAAKEGISTFLSEYHTLPTAPESGDRIERAEFLASWLSSSSYIPGNDWLASEAREVVTQRHGPVPAFSVAIFLFIFGVSPATATIGTHVLAVFVPLVGYFIFKQYFSTHHSRVGTLLIMFSPAYLRWQHTETVGNDIITTLFVGLALFMTFYAMRNNEYRYWFFSGIAFSLPALSKFTVATYTLSIILFIFIPQKSKKEGIVSFGAFIFGFSLLPIILFELGFNIIIMYLFSLAGIFMSSTGNTGLFQYLISYYNARLMGIPLLMLSATAFILIFNNVGNMRNNRKYLIILSAMPAFIPFLFISGVTLSRHLLIHIYILGFMSLYVIETLTDTADRRTIQIFLISTLLVTVVTFS